MTYKTIAIISYFLGCIPFITAIAVFKKTDKKFYPFLYFILVTVLVILLNGSIWLFSTYQQHKLFFDSMAVAYAFTEIIFIFWIFKNLGIFQKREMLFKQLLLFCIVLGLVEFYFHGVSRKMNYFEVFIRMVGTILSLLMINKLVRQNHKNLLTNAEFIISVSFMTYYFIDLASSIFLFDFVTVSRYLKAELMNISSVCAIISAMCFTYALILIGKQSKSKTFGQRPSISIVKEFEITNRTGA